MTRDLGEDPERRAEMSVQELVRDTTDDDEMEEHALRLLISRAIKRGDRLLARHLSALPPRSEANSSIMVQANCPALARIAAVCDTIETMAWRRALVHASVRDDRRRVRALLELAARRCLG
jgi:hypothetical protein